MRNNLYQAGVGGFVSDVYWSSSELNTTNAFAVFFGTGASGNYFKTSLERVRAARQFVAPTGTYAITNIGPAGGRIFNIIAAGGGNSTFYEAAPSDQSAGYKWSDVTTDVNYTSSAAGTGQANTNYIVAMGYTVSAAKLCDNLITYY